MAEEELVPAAEAAVDALRAALPPPWSVKTGDAPAGRVTIEVAHPLTTPHGLNLPDDGRGHARFIEDFLSWREIETLANAPAELPHAPLIQRLRDVAIANGWSRRVVAVLAIVLAKQGVLTSEEGEWLEAAGLPWDLDTEPRAG